MKLVVFVLNQEEIIDEVLEALPDVAVAEAVIGAGIGTIIFIWAVKRTRRWEEE